ncbi:alpha-D-ribose 1-methylphosphonate 5-phosphate C-P-lyase PhnJ [Nocardia sp. NPDC004711]
MTISDINSPATDLAAFVDAAGPSGAVGYLDEGTKRELRRAVLTAVCVPGYQVPFGSREMPIAQGWGSGAVQITLSLIGDTDVVKVIDQGDDAGVNASNIRRFVTAVTGVEETTDAHEATIVQTRHRIPEDSLKPGQILVLQVPMPEPLRTMERNTAEQRRMHAEQDYSRMWVNLYEDQVRNGMITRAVGYPCLVNNRYIIIPSPIPRWDVPKLHRAAHLSLFGAGREKRIYAIPPHTDVAPLVFEDIPFKVEEFPGARCVACGADTSYLVVLPETGEWICSDTAWCARTQDTAEVSA